MNTTAMLLFHQQALGRSFCVANIQYELMHVGNVATTTKFIHKFEVYILNTEYCTTLLLLCIQNSKNTSSPVHFVSYIIPSVLIIHHEQQKQHR